jgi:hypothetical protein
MLPAADPDKDILALWYLPLQSTITKSIYHYLHTKWSLINCPDHARTE